MDRQRGKQIDYIEDGAAREMFSCLRRQVDIQLARQTERYTDSQIDKQIDRKIDRQIDRQIERYTNRQIDKQVDRQIYKYQIYCYKETDIFTDRNIDRVSQIQ